MSSLHKFNVSDTTYHVSPSPTGTLDTESYISNDVNQEDAISYNSINKVTILDNNASIFGKITGMLANVRFLYNKLGILTEDNTYGTVSGTTLNLDTPVDSHSHTVSDLPVTNININSNSYVPTSSLVYNMNEKLNETIDKYNTLGEQITTDSAIGGIQSGTTIASNTNILNIIKQLLVRNFNAYEYKSIDEWSSAADCDNFFSQYNPENGWAGLKLGNCVKINDSTHHAYWMVAGFNCELNRTAATGQSYNNGYGIMLIPAATALYWNGSQWNTSKDFTGGYASSNVNTICNSTVYNLMKAICEYHIVSRRVYLSNGVNATTLKPNSVTSTTRYLTLPTLTQLIGGNTNNIYNNGEANYKLPVFDYHTRNLSQRPYWTRNIEDVEGWGNNTSYWCGFIPSSEYSNPSATRYITCTSSSTSVTIDGESVSQGICIRPIMYLR